jgi:hypothetical protein
MEKVGTLSPFLFQFYVTASVKCENRLARGESFPAIPNMPWLDRKQVVCAPTRYKTHTTTITTMANAGRNGPLTAPNEASSPTTRRRTDGRQPPEQAVINLILGGVRGCMAIKALLCSGDDASPQHRSVSRAIHPLNLQKVVCTCSGGCPPIER